MFFSLYTWRIPSGFPCIQPFTPPPHRQNVTYLFIGNYRHDPSGHPLAPFVLTHFVAGIKKTPKGRETQMKDKFLKLSVMLQILKDENGQDLIEYALVVALIAFAATAGMSALATNINNAFMKIGDRVTTAIT